MKVFPIAIFVLAFCSGSFASPFIGGKIRFLEDLEDNGISIVVEDLGDDYSHLPDSKRITVKWKLVETFAGTGVDLKEVYDTPNGLSIRFVTHSNEPREGPPFYLEWSSVLDNNYEGFSTFIYTPNTGHRLTAFFGNHTSISVSLSIDEFLAGLPKRGKDQTPVDPFLK